LNQKKTEIYLAAHRAQNEALLLDESLRTEHNVRREDRIRRKK